MKYIDSEKLVAEIERYKQGAAIARFDNAGENADYFQGKVDLCDDLTHIITSLQKEQPMPDSTQLIESWNEAKSVLQEKDFRGDEWRLAYNAFMFGFSKGLNTKREK